VFRVISFISKSYQKTSLLKNGIIGPEKKGDTMNSPSTHEERIIDSLMKKDVMKSYAAMPGNDSERQEKIRQVILGRIKRGDGEAKLAVHSRPRWVVMNITLVVTADSCTQLQARLHGTGGSTQSRRT
jgi:hypothetical protein